MAWSRPILLLLLTLGACAAPRPMRSGDRSALDGFPPQATRGPVHVEARYYLDQGRIFGGDLLAGYELVPVALRLGLVEGALQASEVNADPDEMDLVLLLPDGTVCPRVGPEALRVRRRRYERLVQEALPGGLLPHWTAAREGFVYFAAPPGVRFDPQDLTVRRDAPGGERRMHLLDSLVSFQLPVGERLRELNVGLQTDRRSASHLERREEAALQ